MPLRSDTRLKPGDGRDEVIVLACGNLTYDDKNAFSTSAASGTVLRETRVLSFAQYHFVISRESDPALQTESTFCACWHAMLLRRDQWRVLLLSENIPHLDLAHICLKPPFPLSVLIRSQECDFCAVSARIDIMSFYHRLPCFGHSPAKSSNLRSSTWGFCYCESP